MSTWPEQVQAVDAAAARYAIDPILPLALRIAEGRASKYQFGILDPNAMNYTAHLNECCATIHTLLTAYLENPLTTARTSLNLPRTAYTDAFIKNFAATYCPIGPHNNPARISHKWIRTIIDVYHELLAIGADHPSWNARWTHPQS
jgi:hypothetical protein